MNRKRIGRHALLGLLCGVLAVAAAVSAAAWSERAETGLFSKNNLVAWCIVPYDAKKRGPEERARMLKGLGITKLAYDWRQEHIPTFDQELDALTREGIRLHAFWVYSGPEPASDPRVAAVLDFLRRRKVRTEIWYQQGLPKNFGELTAQQQVETAANAVGYIAREAARLKCKVGLYNHGGWFGEPENQIAIIERLKAKHVGIVYNFHHAHEHIDRFPELLGKMKPHLLAINLNGMRREGPKILYIGEGDQERKMMEEVRRSGYRGPIGILNHQTDVDAEEGLRRNMDGLMRLAGS
jgi:sugar phosphate isomerase/epimerase